MRVFPAGRMCSLRGVLMMWLLPVFLVVGAVSAFVSYLSYTHTVATFMDDQMSLLAQSVAAQSGTPVLPPVGPEQVKDWGAYVVQVFDAQGGLQVTSLPGSGIGFIGNAGFHDVHGAAGDWRVYVAAGSGSQHVQVAQSGIFRTKLAAGRALGVFAPVLVLLLLSGAILWFVVEMVSRAVGDIARQTSQQDEHSIAELPLSQVPREIAPLVVSFNSLLSRLRDAFSTQRRFVQDAAHELRTPITAVGLQLETLRADVCCGDTLERYTQLELGVQRAQRLVDQLLRLSRQESAPGEAAPAEIDVATVLRESVNALIVLAEQRRIDLGVLPGAKGAVPLRCAVGDLRSVLDNLIENALHHTPEGGVVDVRMTHEGHRLVIEVIDSGPGIPPELAERVFDRFFRVPGNGTRGNGLGLAIARTAAERCGMRITLRNRTDGSGLIARVEQA